MSCFVVLLFILSLICHDGLVLAFKNLELPFQFFLRLLLFSFYWGLSVFPTFSVFGESSSACFKAVQQGVIELSSLEGSSMDQENLTGKLQTW